MKKQEKDISQKSEKFIDIENIIQNKLPRLLKIISHCVIKYLKRIIHENELNAALARNKDFHGLDFVEKILEEFQVQINVINTNNIPITDRFFLVSNHPLGGLDGMALLHVVGKVKKNIVFPVNDLLMFLPNLRCLFIPINKHGSNSENIKIIEETFVSEKTILYFPAGLCSRKKKGNIVDAEWKKTFITKARQHQRNVIPIHIDGKNSNFFYRISNFRKFLGIKFNVEMLYLVDEMYKQKNKKISITFGKPISFTTFDKRFNDKEWAEKVKQHVYELGKNKEIVFSY